MSEMKTYLPFDATKRLVLCMIPIQAAILNSFMLIPRYYSPGRVYFNGIVTGGMQTLFPAGCSFIVVLNHPHCTGVFHREDASNFVDNLYSLSDLDQDYRDITELLCERHGLRDKITAIEDFLLHKIKHGIICPVTKRSVEAIRTHLFSKDIPALAKAVYASERSLRRKFVQHLGVSPQKYIGLFRFRNMVKDLTTANGPIDW